MATVKTDTYTSQSAASVRNSLIPGKTITGEVLYATATYTATGSEAADDVVQVVQLPVGAQVIPDLCKLTTDGVGGTTATVAKLGDASDDDRYSATAIGITSAATNTAFTATNAIALTPFTITEATKVVTATLGLASGSFTAGKKVRFRIAYRAS